MNAKRCLNWFALATIILTSGCASIVSEKNYVVGIHSVPDRAKFTVTDRKGLIVAQGKTPAQVTLRAGDGYFKSARYTLKFEKAGYEDAIVPVNADLDPWYWGNAVFLYGALITALIVDPATGAMWELPDRIQANLQESPDSASIYSSSASDFVDPAWEKETSFVNGSNSHVK